jgi:hypothetical protein
LSYPSAVLEKARRLAEEKDPGIIPDDMRPILFCPVEDLEGTLCHGTETSFFDALAAATGDRFAGWSLPNVQRELTGESGNKYPLHGRLGELLPWWAALEQRKAKLGLE